MIFLLIAIILILTDQLLKMVVMKYVALNAAIDLNIIKISNIQKHSMLFNFDINIVLVILSIIIAVLFTYFFINIFLKNIKKMYVFIPYVLIMSGLVSNIIDRMFRGFVFKYIEIPIIFKGVYLNLANGYITLGVIILLVIVLLRFSDYMYANIEVKDIDNKDK